MAEARGQVYVGQRLSQVGKVITALAAKSEHKEDILFRGTLVHKVGRSLL